MKRLATSLVLFSLSILGNAVKADQTTFTARVTAPSNGASFKVVVIPYYGWYPAPVDGSSVHTITYYNSTFNMLTGVSTNAIATLSHGLSPYPNQQGWGKTVVDSVASNSSIGVPPFSTRTIGTKTLSITNQTWFIPGLWITQATTASYGYGSTQSVIDSVNWEVTY